MSGDRITTAVEHPKQLPPDASRDLQLLSGKMQIQYLYTIHIYDHWEDKYMAAIIVVASCVKDSVD